MIQQWRKGLPAGGQSQLGKRLPDECASAAAGADRLRLYVVAEETVRVTFGPGTPKTLSACATRVVHATDVPRGTALLVDVSLVPRPFREAVDAALKDAETRCASAAVPGQSVEGILSGAAGAKPEVVLASGTPALRSQLEHVRFDTFRTRFADRNIEDAYVTFALNPDGSIRDVTLKPVSPLADFSFNYKDLLFRPAKN